jgi:hypothetical protein
MKAMKGSDENHSRISGQRVSRQRWDFCRPLMANCALIDE